MMVTPPGFPPPNLATGVPSPRNQHAPPLGNFVEKSCAFIGLKPVRSHKKSRAPALIPLWQPGYLLILEETRGFPSPPHGGFGLNCSDHTKTIYVSQVFFYNFH
jgi:hypothetical protein